MEYFENFKYNITHLLSLSMMARVFMGSTGAKCVTSTLASRFSQGVPADGGRPQLFGSPQCKEERKTEEGTIKPFYFSSVLFHCALPFPSIPVSCVGASLPAVKDFKSHPSRGNGRGRRVRVAPNVPHVQKNTEQRVAHALRVLVKQ